MMGRFHQAFTAITACFGSALIGTLTVWPSYTLELFTAENTTLLQAPMTELEASLLSSLPSLGCMLGTGMCGVVIDAIGRKNGALVFTMPFIICWIIIEFSSTPVPMMVARFIGGVGGGANGVYAPIFVSEIAEPAIRGALTSGLITLYCLGVLVSYIIGWVFSYRMIIWINLALAVINVALILVVVESPVYLLKKNRNDEALKALAHYRTDSISSKSVLEELSAIKQQLRPAIELIRADAMTKTEDAEKQKLNESESLTVETKKTSPLTALVTTPSSLRAFLVVGNALTLQVLMGMVAVQVYAGELFSKAAPGLSSDFCSVLFALVLFAGGLVTTAIADRVGRRVLLISSSALVAVCMSVLGALLQTSVAPPWVSAVVILVYCFCFNYGAGAVPYVLLAEVFTPEVQSFASMILVELAWLLNFIIIAIFPYMTSLMGMHGTFYAFACVGAANALISHYCVPETAGLSNRQIQEVFRK